MPKIKVNKSAAKRFRTTASGKLKRSKAFKSHILTKKKSKRKTQLTQADYVDPSNEKNMKRLLGMR